MNDDKKPDGDSRFVATPDDFIFGDADDPDEDGGDDGAITEALSPLQDR